MTDLRHVRGALTRNSNKDEILYLFYNIWNYFTIYSDFYYLTFLSYIGTSLLILYFLIAIALRSKLLIIYSFIPVILILNSSIFRAYKYQGIKGVIIDILWSLFIYLLLLGIYIIFTKFIFKIRDNNQN